MTLETRKIRLVQSILGDLSEEAITSLEIFIKNEVQLKEVLTQRALQSEDDIKNGKVFAFKEAKQRVKSSLGL